MVTDDEEVESPVLDVRDALGDRTLDEDEEEEEELRGVHQPWTLS